MVCRKPGGGRQCHQLHHQGPRLPGLALGRCACMALLSFSAASLEGMLARGSAGSVSATKAPNAARHAQLALVSLLAGAWRPCGNASARSPVCPLAASTVRVTAAQMAARQSHTPAPAPASCCHWCRRTPPPQSSCAAAAGPTSTILTVCGRHGPAPASRPCLAAQEPLPLLPLLPCELVQLPRHEGRLRLFTMCSELEKLLRAWVAAQLKCRM